MEKYALIVIYYFSKHISNLKWFGHISKLLNILVS